MKIIKHNKIVVFRKKILICREHSNDLTLKDVPVFDNPRIWGIRGELFQESATRYLILKVILGHK
jgi:hypothetical protein